MWQSFFITPQPDKKHSRTQLLKQIMEQLKDMLPCTLQIADSD
jgi:hypothetical protein